MMELLRVRSLMSAVKEASGVFDYGTFNVVNPRYPSYKYHQVSTTDYAIEVDLGKLTFVPEKILAIYDDDVNEYSLANNATVIFYANEVSNKHCYADGGGSWMENKSFKESDAKYVRYDEESKKLYLHINQWQNIKCGKWRWIALGVLNDE